MISDVKKLVKLLSETQAAYYNIDANMGRLSETMPKPPFPEPGTVSDEEVRALYGRFISGLESIEDAAERYLNSTRAVTEFVRASLEPNLPGAGDDVWTPPEE